MEPTTIFKPTGFAVSFRTRAMKSSNGRRAVELAKSFRRMAIDAHRNAADGRDLGRNLLLWQQPALSGVSRPARGLISTICTCGKAKIARAFAETYTP